MIEELAINDAATEEAQTRHAPRDPIERFSAFSQPVLRAIGR